MVGLSTKLGSCQPIVNIRSLAAAVLAHALTDLLRGRDTAGVLSWIDGRPAALPFWMACHWLDISPRNTPVQGIRQIGAILHAKRSVSDER